MRDILYYKTATGEIIGSGNFEDDALAADIIVDMEADESYTDGIADADQDYIAFPGGTPTVTARPALLSDNDVFVVADNTITVDFPLPTGTVVTFNNAETISIAGEHFQFRSDGLTGTYEFLIDPPFPYIPVAPLRINVHAV